jgi:hypothetical protein
MSNSCSSKILNGVIVQENGIIRNNNGHYLGTLSDKVEYDDEALNYVITTTEQEKYRLEGWERAMHLLGLVLHDTGGVGASDNHSKGWDDAVNEIEQQMNKIGDSAKTYINLSLEDIG